MKRSGGFTVMEIVIVLVILGIMAGTAMPMFQGSIERARANEAAANLNAIYMGQRIFRTDRGTFFDGNGDMEQQLSIDLESRFYDYAIIQADAATFTARATRNATAGGDVAQNITINQNGCFGGSAGNPNIPAQMRQGC